MLKLKTLRDKKHLKFVGSLPCVKCSRESIAAHIRSGTDGGMGLKPSDYYTVPLCHQCHTIQHNKGEKTFWRNIENARCLAIRIYEHSNDKEKCLSLISQYRSTI